MKNRKASDRLSECVINLLHEYKKQVEILNYRIDYLTAECKGYEKKLFKAVTLADNAHVVLGEIAEIIAGFTEHTDDGYIKVYMSNRMSENAVKLERLFKLLDIPMTADQIKEGGENEES